MHLLVRPDVPLVSRSAPRNLGPFVSRSGSRGRIPCRRAAAALLACAVAACGEPGIPVTDRVVTVACGACIFDMPGVENCPWAAELDGHHYLLRGSLPLDHNSHLADGICNMRRQARLTGEIRGDLLVVSRFELLPAAPEAVPEEPRFTPADVH